MRWTGTLLGLTLGLATFAGSGCGRAAPEGYARVRVSLGQTFSKAAAESGKSQAAFVLCTVPHLVLRVTGPEIDPPENHPLDASIDITAFPSASSGSELFQPFSTEILVKAGPERVFELSGVFYDACETGTASHPIYGKTDPMDIGEPVEVAITAVASASGFAVASLPGGIDLTGTDFVVQTVNWTDTLGSCGLTSMDQLYVYDVEQEMLLSPPAGAGNSAFFGASAHSFGPLMPNRLYILLYEVTVGASSDQVAYFLITGTEASGSISFSRCPVP